MPLVAGLTLSDFADKVVRDARPMEQNTDESNMGFGWIYYSVVRNLRPDVVIAIGSCRGFMPFCAARGIKDNQHGRS